MDAPQALAPPAEHRDDIERYSDISLKDPWLLREHTASTTVNIWQFDCRNMVSSEVEGLSQLGQFYIWQRNLPTKPTNSMRSIIQQLQSIRMCP